MRCRLGQKFNGGPPKEGPLTTSADASYITPRDTICWNLLQYPHCEFHITQFERKVNVVREGFCPPTSIRPPISDKPEGKLMTPPYLQYVCDWRLVHIEPKFAEQARMQLQHTVKVQIRDGGARDAYRW